jgi:tetratricopeptide (TPR) repeat protein
MRVAIPFALFLSAAALHAAAPEQTRQKLRSLAMLPSLSFSFSTYTTDLRYPELAVSQQELIGRINDLQRKLRESPDEPGLELELGRFLRAVGRTNESKRAAAKAIELFRPQAHDAPRDIGVQIDIAHALEAAGNLDEAESVLRRSVAIATNEWRCWDGLGELLDAKEEIVLGGTQWASTTLPVTDQFTFSSGSSVPAVLLSNPPPAALIKEAESVENEADSRTQHILDCPELKCSIGFEIGGFGGNPGKAAATRVYAFGRLNLPVSLGRRDGSLTTCRMGCWGVMGN